MNQTDYFPFGMLNDTWFSGTESLSGVNPDWSVSGISGEMDNEAKGEGNSYTTEFRQYDSRIGRWLSLDPLMAQYPMMSPYVAFNNNPIYFVDPLGLEGDPPLGGDNGRNECDDGKIDINSSEENVRLYIVNQNCKDKGDNQTFWDASKYIQKFHASIDGNWNKIKDRKSVESGSEIRDYINSQKTNSICSADFFTHGGSEGLWFKHWTEAVFTNRYFQLDLKYLNFYTSEKDYEESDNRYSGDIKSNFSQITKSSSLDALNYANFTYDCRVEIHGCGTSGDNYSDQGGNIFCSVFSKKLFQAGKKSAVVIGHYGASGPYYPEGIRTINVNGKNLIFGIPDYRQNERRVYWNGNLVLTTFQKGNIEQQYINYAILYYKITGNPILEKH